MYILMKLYNNWNHAYNVTKLLVCENKMLGGNCIDEECQATKEKHCKPNHIISLSTKI